MTRLEIAHLIAVVLVYSLISLYASRVVYLIGERIWIALRRWYELRQINKAFESDMDSGFIAEHNARQKVGFDDVPLLIETMKAEMFPKRSAPEYEDSDADYSALTLEETTSQEAA